MTASRRVSFLPSAQIRASSSGPPSPSPDSGADNKTAFRVIVLAMLIQTLRSRRFYERVAVAAIVLAALAGLNRESGAKAFRGLVRWAEHQDERFERRVKAALTE